ncbi:glycosyltransferase [Massilia sp. PWRC2]|uniref:glycosyltransferase n=1 Tax=Massilia sp. PWRC2 TaxID=2804626 RepID=UPI003CE6CDC8
MPAPLPRILVLLATYNGVQWLREQINSILAQQGVVVDLLIGDDCSGDGTATFIIEEWGSNPRITLICWPSPSGSAGANFRRLYRHANAEAYDFVALADQDDIWFPAKLENAVFMLTKEDAQGYSCAVEAFWPGGRVNVLAQNPHLRDADFIFEGAGQGCTFVLTRKLFICVQDFCVAHPDEADGLHYHDWLIYLIARRLGKGWCFDRRPHMRYRQHGGNEIGSRGTFGAATRRLALMKNGWYAAQIMAASAAASAVPVKSDTMDRIRILLSEHDSLTRRAKMMCLVARSGRRKLHDRLLLVFVAGCGWI